MVDEFRGKWYKKALTLTEKINIPGTMLRVVATQIHTSNTPSESVSDYYKRTITIPLLDYLMCELDYRFSSSETEAIFNSFVILPVKLIAIVHEPQKGHWKKKIIFANFIRDDLPNALSLDSELDLWEKYWISYRGSLPDNVPNTLKSIKFSGFHNIEVALRIIGTMQVTSCECEVTSFSGLKRLKTYTRMTMVAERLNGLALLHVHKHIIVNIDKVIDLYAIKNRRLKFC